MSVRRAYIASVSLVLGCAPAARDELADASWVVGRYATGEGCTLKGVDQNGEPIVDGWIIDCTTGRWVDLEFFADGRVESDFYTCHDATIPYSTEESRWHATEDEGEVIVDSEAGEIALFFFGARMDSATIRRRPECSQILAEEDDDDQPSYAILHRGEFQWVDLSPDGCELTAQPVSVPQCPADEDG